MCLSGTLRFIFMVFRSAVRGEHFCQVQIKFVPFKFQQNKSECFLRDLCNVEGNGDVSSQSLGYRCSFLLNEEVCAQNPIFWISKLLHQTISNDSSRLFPLQSWSLWTNSWALWSHTNPCRTLCIDFEIYKSKMVMSEANLALVRGAIRW